MVAVVAVVMVMAMAMVTIFPASNVNTELKTTARLYYC